MRWWTRNCLVVTPLLSTICMLFSENSIFQLSVTGKQKTGTPITPVFVAAGRRLVGECATGVCWAGPAAMGCLVLPGTPLRVECHPTEDGPQTATSSWRWTSRGASASTPPGAGRAKCGSGPSLMEMTAWNSGSGQGMFDSWAKLPAEKIKAVGS